MSTTPSVLERFRPHSVPVCVFAVVAAAAVLAPPLVLDLSARTYAIAAAVLILGVTSAAPYAVTVSVVTLPLLYAGADVTPRISTAAAMAYVLADRSSISGGTSTAAAATMARIQIGTEWGRNRSSVEGVIDMGAGFQRPE